MQINSLNSNINNNRQMQTQKSVQNPSFKSIMQTKIMLNGREITDKKIRKAIYTQFHEILFNGKDKNELAKSIQQIFSKTDKEFIKTAVKELRSSVMRHESIGYTNYTFTGKHADELNELGKKIGLSQEGLKNKEERKAARKISAKPYYKKVIEFINRNGKHSRLKNNEGDELCLTINVIRPISKKGKEGKIQISNIEFKPMPHYRTQTTNSYATTGTISAHYARPNITTAKQTANLAMATQPTSPTTRLIETPPINTAIIPSETHRATKTPSYKPGIQTDLFDKIV